MCHAGCIYSEILIKLIVFTIFWGACAPPAPYTQGSFVPVGSARVDPSSSSLLIANMQPVFPLDLLGSRDVNFAPFAAVHEPPRP
jgi:hypothetical protein